MDSEHESSPCIAQRARQGSAGPASSPKIETSLLIFAVPCAIGAESLQYETTGG